MKAGLEIHQQLKAGKLFCRCPSVLREDAPHFTVSRKLRPVASETGARDLVSEAEAAKGKTFAYEAYRDTTCLVEIDEEPPLAMDRDALEIACAIAKSLNCAIVPELHTMRKAIIDGSCPGGFQRTGLLATDGWLDVGKKRVGIQTISIEEDSGRIISAEGGRSVFRVDRLGIPLVEIATAPDIATPEEARQVAERIGAILRLTGRVVRGIGSIRQDLNVSTEEGGRIEIKGVQWLDLIPLFVANEVARQGALISLGRKHGGAKTGRRLADVTAVFESTQSKVLGGKRVLATSFPGLAGLMRETLHEGKHFGKEVAEYVRVKTRAKGFFHTDELPAYGVTDREVAALRKALGAGEKDLVCIVADEPSALEVVEWRISALAEGVPKETRKANPDGSTSFLRPIAGSARFYPETDVPPVRTAQFVTKAKTAETPEERMAALKKLGLSDNLAKGLLLSEDYPLFTMAVSAGVQPTLAAATVLETLTSLRRKGTDVDRIADLAFGALFAQISKGFVLRDSVPQAIESLAKGESFSAEVVSDAAVEDAVNKLIDEKWDFIAKTGRERALPGLMGELMRTLRGKVDGARLKAALERNLLKHGEDGSA